MALATHTTQWFAYLLLVVLVNSLAIHRSSYLVESTTPIAHAAATSGTLQLTMSDDREFVRAGEEITMRLEIANSTPEAIDGSTLIVHIPDYLVPFETSPASEANPDNRTITWKHISIPAEGAAQFAIRARIAAETPQKTRLITRAQVTADQITSSVTDLTTVQAVEVVSEAARTVAPTLAPTPASTPPAQPVVPTAKTGSGTGIAIAVISLLTAFVTTKKIGSY